MIGSILVVCVGNICRSPLGEALLRRELEARGLGIPVSSSGIKAMVGSSADTTTRQVASERGVSLAGHVARQFSTEIGRSADLILVMEAAHKARIIETAPALSGKVMLFDQWIGGEGIPDPYQRSHAYHEAVHTLIEKSAVAWADRIAATESRSR